MSHTNNKRKKVTKENSTLKSTERTTKESNPMVQDNPYKMPIIDKRQITEHPEDGASVAELGKYQHPEMKRMISDLNKNIKEIAKGRPCINE